MQTVKRLGFCKCLEVEFLKLKNSPLWWAVLLLPLLSIFIGSGSYYLNNEALSGGAWYGLWTQVALFYGYFFYPLLMGIAAACLWRIEHNQNNWNLLGTLPVDARDIWFSKLTVLFFVAIISQVFMVALYVFSGFVILRFRAPLPATTLWYLFAGPVCVMAVASVQLYLSLKIKSFTAPIGICFIGCFVGLFCYLNGFWLFPDTLAIIGINATHESLPTFSEIIKVVSGTFFWVVLTSVLGIRDLHRRES